MDCAMSSIAHPPALLAVRADHATPKDRPSDPAIPVLDIAA